MLEENKKKKKKGDLLLVARELAAPRHELIRSD